MTLRVAQKPTYFWPVVVEYPVDGKFVKDTFDAEFRRLPKGEIKDLLARAVDAKDPIDDGDIARAVVVGWKNVTSDEGPVDFSPSTYADLAQAIPRLDTAVAEAWMQSIQGSQVKN